MSPLSQCQVSYVGWATVHFLGLSGIRGQIDMLSLFFLFCFFFVLGGYLGHGHGDWARVGARSPIYFFFVFRICNLLFCNSFA